MGYYPFLDISLNGHNSSQEQDRDMPQENFLFRITCLKLVLNYFFYKTGVARYYLVPPEIRDSAIAEFFAVIKATRGSQTIPQKSIEPP